MPPTLLAIAMPGPFEVMVLLGMITVPLAAAIAVVWLMLQERGKKR